MYTIFRVLLGLVIGTFCGVCLAAVSALLVWAGTSIALGDFASSVVWWKEFGRGFALLGMIGMLLGVMIGVLWPTIRDS